MKRHDPWKPGYRHSVDLRQTPEGHIWFCKWCRQDFAEWPSDTLACPGPDASCPRCRSAVVGHPWSRFADETGEHPWVCGRCYGDDHPDSQAITLRSGAPGDVPLTGGPEWSAGDGSEATHNGGRGA